MFIKRDPPSDNNNYTRRPYTPPVKAIVPASIAEPFKAKFCVYSNTNLYQIGSQVGEGTYGVSLGGDS